MKAYPETHQFGHVSIENLNLVAEMPLKEADFGVQIASDGRVWICINGVAFLRFKPNYSKQVQQK